jgi:hypothetical protein
MGTSHNQKTGSQEGQGMMLVQVVGGHGLPHGWGHRLSALLYHEPCPAWDLRVLFLRVIWCIKNRLFSDISCMSPSSLSTIVSPGLDGSMRALNAAEGIGSSSPVKGLLGGMGELISISCPFLSFLDISME